MSSVLPGLQIPGWCLPSGSWSVLQCKAIGAPSYCADDKILNDPRQGVASSFAISLTCADSNHYLIATRQSSRRQQSGYGYRLLRDLVLIGYPLKWKERETRLCFAWRPRCTIVYLNILQKWKPPAIDGQLEPYFQMVRV